MEEEYYGWDEYYTYEVKLKDFLYKIQNKTGEMHIFVCIFSALFASIIVLDGKVTRLKCKLYKDELM